jgi:hypothetical protein
LSGGFRKAARRGRNFRTCLIEEGRKVSKFATGQLLLDAAAEKKSVPFFNSLAAERDARSRLRDEARGLQSGARQMRSPFIEAFIEPSPNRRREYRLGNT